MIHDGQLHEYRLEVLGYRIAAYPLTLLNAAIGAMEQALASLEKGESPAGLMPFARLREIVGFDAYEQEQARYAEARSGDGEDE